MDEAAISLGALAVAIVVSCTIRLHVGFLAIALAWIVGVYVAGMSANDVIAGFPTRLFLTLALLLIGHRWMTQPRRARSR